ncbi:MAG: SDR family oxidoreductase [Acidobacteriota bacterium]|nr:SDR family oxidoreductase [Acidobacteriota bacterium]
MSDAPSSAGGGLVGRVAIVTGGSRGIGLATAAALLDEGASVLICGRSEDALVRAASQLEQHAGGGTIGRLATVAADIRQLQPAEHMIQTAIDRFGGVDILINNAGVGRFALLSELSVDDWLEVIETNLSGVFYCSRAAIPVMKQRGGGWIINVSSLAGKHPFAGGTAYCASKAGLNALTEALMQEVRHDKIRVSCVLPGSVDTEFAGNQPSPEVSWKLASSDVARAILDLIHHPARSLPSRVELRPSMPRTT